MTGKVYSLNISKEKGTRKYFVPSIMVIENFGFENDAHAGNSIRQVSLLSIENIEKQNRLNKEKNINLYLEPGDYAENITTQGIDLSSLKIGDMLMVGSDVVLRISKIGKECHHGCHIFEKIKSCIMPNKGIFAIVERGGRIENGDIIRKSQNA